MGNSLQNLKRRFSKRRGLNEEPPLSLTQCLRVLCRSSCGCELFYLRRLGPLGKAFSLYSPTHRITDYQTFKVLQRLLVQHPYYMREGNRTASPKPL